MEVCQLPELPVVIFKLQCQIKFVEDIEDPRMAKSLIISYILWFFGGFVGLHHFYLNRTTQGFLWLCLPGKFLQVIFYIIYFA